MFGTLPPMGFIAGTANPFLLLEGSGTRAVVLAQNDLSGAANQVKFGGDASPQAVLSH
jgi:hypothetical protein